MDLSLKRKASEVEFPRRKRRISDGVPDIVKVGSRKSQLAIIQTTTIVNKLQELNKDLKLEIETMETLGDKILNIALPKIGEKSLFTKDLEIALESKRVDFLVHSLKDLPTTLPEGMVISTIYKRDDPHDCVIFHSKHAGKTLADLPNDSIIGTSSLRRVAQLKRCYSHLQFKSVRGNLNTRLRKLEEESMYDGIILAKAGVDRMGWTQKIGQILTEDECLYAIGQGAMAVEVRADDKYTINMLGELTDMKGLLSCAAERAFMRKLNGGCSTPIGCYTRIQDGKMTLRGVVLSASGQIHLDQTVDTDIKTDIPGTKNHKKCYVTSKSSIVIDEMYTNELDKAEGLGERLAVALKELGADQVLSDVRAQLPNISNIQVPTSSSDAMSW